ncbi:MULTISPECIES: hypothetical protein [Kribbella]|uniref:WD40 repeat protein n=1 Tax=Kribbella karoonensis TaxID=324851 RepID=A0ABN2E5G9_9ACTN
MDEDEELVELGGPRFPRWVRLGGLLVVAVAVLALIVVRAWPGQGATPLVTVSPSPPAQVVGAWPTAPGSCGARHELAIVSSTPRKEKTGLTMLMGGDRLRAVDFDDNSVTVIDGLRPGEFGDVRTGSTGPLVTTSTCRPGGSRILHVGSGRKAGVAGSLGSLEVLLTGGDGAWVVLSPPDPDQGAGFVRRLDADHWTRLPVGFSPYAASDDQMVGFLEPSQSGPSSRLVLVSATTGRQLADLGQDAQPVATGAGEVLWTTGCNPSSASPCDLHRRRLATGSTATYRLPHPACCGGPGVVSPDGREVAFLLERAAVDSRYEGHPMRPSNLAVLQLASGRLEIVPGIELPPKSSPGLAFSADGRWLAIALDAGPRIRLLAWRSGVQHPYEAKPIRGQVLWAATVATVANGW